MALIWIAAYGALYIVGESVSRFLGYPHLITCLLVTVFLVTLLLWMAKRGTLNQYGLRKPRDTKSMVVIAAPLLAIPLLNLYFAATTNPETEPLLATTNPELFHISLAALTLLLLGAVLEEIFFRGYLIAKLREQTTWSITKIIYAQALLFGILHLANTTSMPEIANTTALFFQVIYACALGIALGYCTLATKSILPAIAIHSLINLTALPPTSALIQVIYVCLSVLLVLWTKIAFDHMNYAPHYTHKNS